MITITWNQTTRQPSTPNNTTGSRKAAGGNQLPPMVWNDLAIAVFCGVLRLVLGFGGLFCFVVYFLSCRDLVGISSLFPVDRGVNNRSWLRSRAIDDGLLWVGEEEWPCYVGSIPFLAAARNGAVGGQFRSTTCLQYSRQRSEMRPVFRGTSQQPDPYTKLI